MSSTAQDVQSQKPTVLASATADDLSGAYLANHEAVQNTSAADALTREMESAPQEGATAKTGPIAPVAQPSGSSLPARIVKDVGKGIVETPRAAFTGIRDAVQNTVNLAADLGNWTDQHIPTPALVHDPEKGWRLGSSTEVEPWNPKLPLPEVSDPESVTGRLIKGVFQFTRGMSMAGNLLKDVGVTAQGYGMDALKGAMGMFAAFDPHQQRLSNLVEQFPALSNPVTRFLAAKPDDSAAEGRFKNALEGTGLGLLTDGFVKSVKLLRDVTLAKGAAEEAAGGAEGVQALEGPQDAAPGAQGAEAAPAGPPPPTNPEEFLGGSAAPEAPLVDFGAEQEASRMASAEQSTEGMTPEEVLAMRGAQAPAEAAKLNTRTPDASQDSLLEFLSKTKFSGAEGRGVSIDKLAEELGQSKADFRGAAGSGINRPFTAKGSDELDVIAQHLAEHGYPVVDEAGNPDPEKLKEAIQEELGGSKVYSSQGTRHLDEMAANRYAEEKPAGPPTGEVKINFARINTPEDVQSVIQQMADKFKSGIEESTRGVRSFEQTKLSADKEDAWKTLMGRRTGEPLNAEQSVAARQLWVSSGERVAQLAQTAAQSDDPGALFAFRKMLATHVAIQEQVIGARTEIARSLGSWNIPVEGANKADAISSILDNLGGGPSVSRELAVRIAGLSQANMASDLESVVGKTAFARTREAVMAGWINGLLSNPATQFKILASNVSTAVWRIAERKGAEKISALLGQENGVAAGEAASMWTGYIDGIKDSLAYAGKMAHIAAANVTDSEAPALTAEEAASPVALGVQAAKTGITKAGIGRPQEPMPNPISSEALQVPADSALGKGLDMLGFATSIGPRGISAQHDMALTFAYRAELNAQAVRQATAEINAGASEAGFAQRVAELVADPPKNLQSASADQALYQAFLDAPGPFAKWLQDGTRKFPALKAIQPFVGIVSRIFNYSFERTPLAPLMSKFRADIAAGGARQSLALSQIGIGTMITLATADLTMNGRFRALGPPETGLKQAQGREGEIPFSGKVGDRWVSVYGVHPLGTTMGLAASVTEAFMNSQHELVDDVDAEKLAAGTVLAIAANVTNQSYMSGAANFFATMHDGQGAAAGSVASSALHREVASLTPMSGLTGAIDRVADPYVREVQSNLDAFKAKIPGLSNTLSPARDLWGYPKSRSAGLPAGAEQAYQLFSPVQMREASHEPIDDEILRLGANIANPQRTQTFSAGPGAGSVPIDLAKYPNAYSRFMELAGHELKSPVWGTGARDTLNAIVSGEHPLSEVYKLRSDGPEGGKDIFIRDIIRGFRDDAKRQLLQEFPDLKAEVDAKADKQRELKMPGQSSAAGANIQ